MAIAVAAVPEDSTVILVVRLEVPPPLGINKDVCLTGPRRDYGHRVRCDRTSMPMWLLAVVLAVVHGAATRQEPGALAIARDTYARRR